MHVYKRLQKFNHPVVKYYNDLLDRQSFGRGRDEVTYCGEVFCIYLGTMYTDFQEKNFAEISGKIPKLFIEVTLLVSTIKSLSVFSRNLREDFFLKIGINSAKKVYTKNFPNIEVDM